MPLLTAVRATGPLAALDFIGAALAIVGLAVEATADRQLRRVRADPSSRGRVLDSGL